MLWVQKCAVTLLLGLRYTRNGGNARLLRMSSDKYKEKPNQALASERTTIYKSMIGFSGSCMGEGRGWS
jgi:hypothetical protein